MDKIFRLAFILFITISALVIQGCSNDSNLANNKNSVNNSQISNSISYKEPLPEKSKESQNVKTVKGKEDSTAFRMYIEDVFDVPGKGLTATGRVDNGHIKAGDTLDLIDIDGNYRTVTCTGIEGFRKLIDTAKKGDNIGILLSGITHNEVTRGMLLTTPGTTNTYLSLRTKMIIIDKNAFKGNNLTLYVGCIDKKDITIAKTENIQKAGNYSEGIVTLKFKTPLVSWKGQGLALRANHKTVADVKVLECLE